MASLGYKQEQRFHLELGLLKLVHAQRLLPLEQLLSGEVSQGGARSAVRSASANAARRDCFHLQSIDSGATCRRLRASVRARHRGVTILPAVAVRSRPQPQKRA